PSNGKPFSFAERPTVCGTTGSANWTMNDPREAVEFSLSGSVGSFTSDEIDASAVGFVFAVVPTWNVQSALALQPFTVETPTRTRSTVAVCVSVTPSGLGPHAAAVARLPSTSAT